MGVAQVDVGVPFSFREASSSYFLFDEFLLAYMQSERSS